MISRQKVLAHCGYASISWATDPLCSARVSFRPTFIFGSHHLEIAEIRLICLNSQLSHALPADFFYDPSGLANGKPFLKYWSLYQGVHAKRGLSGYVGLLELELLQIYNIHRSTCSLIEQIGNIDLEEYPTTTLLNGLHYASFYYQV